MRTITGHGSRIDVDRSDMHDEIIVMRVEDTDDHVLVLLSPSDARAHAAALLALVEEIERGR